MKQKFAITISCRPGKQGRAASVVRVDRRLFDRLPGGTYESTSHTNPYITGKGTYISLFSFKFLERENLSPLLPLWPRGVCDKRPVQPLPNTLSHIIRTIPGSLLKRRATVAVLSVIEFQHGHIAIRSDPASATPPFSTLDLGR
jgi:hypothetical protein